MAQAFGLWKHDAWKQRALRSAASHLMHAGLAKAFTSWREYAAERRVSAAKAVTAVTQWRAAAAAAALRCWVEYAAARRVGVAMAGRAVAQWRAAAAAAAFGAWLEYSAVRQEATAQACRAVGRWRAAATATAFRAWMEAMITQRAKRSRLEAALRTMQNQVRPPAKHVRKPDMEEHLEDASL